VSGILRDLDKLYTRATSASDETNRRFKEFQEGKKGTDGVWQKVDQKN